MSDRRCFYCGAADDDPKRHVEKCPARRQEYAAGHLWRGNGVGVTRRLSGGGEGTEAA